MRWKPDCKCNPLSASMSSLLDPDTEAASSPELEKGSSHISGAGVGEWRSYNYSL